jgi:hypothetical protein
VNIGLPLFDEPQVPYRGASATTRATSASGARAALDGRGAKLARLAEVYREPRTMQDAARITGWPISSVCSLTDALKKRGLLDAGAASHEWPDGRVTWRTRWVMEAR